MMRYSTLLFDLDGTLTDSREGIINCFRHTAEVMGAELPENTDCLLGPPLGFSFENFFGMDSKKAEEAVRVYRRRYGDTGLFENRVYGGVPEMLETLSKNGFMLCVATCKAEIYAVRILDKFGLSRYFKVIGGSDTEGRRTSKTEVIDYVLMRAGVSDRSRVLMVGDRDNDVLGAHSSGIDCLGVLWGYGSAEELAGAGADMTADTPQSAAEMIIRKEDSYV